MDTLEPTHDPATQYTRVVYAIDGDTATVGPNDSSWFEVFGFPTPCTNTIGFVDIYGDGCGYYEADANYPLFCESYGANGPAGNTPNEHCCVCKEALEAKVEVPTGYVPPTVPSPTPPRPPPSSRPSAPTNSPAPTEALTIASTTGGTTPVGTNKTLSPTPVFVGSPVWAPSVGLFCSHGRFILNLTTDAFGMDTTYEVIDRNDDSVLTSRSGFPSNTTLQTSAACLKSWGCYAREGKLRSFSGRNSIRKRRSVRLF
ncbi:hypothetical protein ACHAXT_009375 [Thalassiosira profunda]